jgi:hypothetical protein
VAAQIFTLIGVVIGALASYLASSFNERARYRRELRRGWADKRLEVYGDFIASIKEFTAVTRMMAVEAGLPDRMPPIAREEGQALLQQAELRRGGHMERLSLIADTDTLLAARALNRASWQLEGLVVGTIPNSDGSSWDDGIRFYNEAINNFHQCARREMQVPGAYPDRTREPSPRADAFLALDDDMKALHLKNVGRPGGNCRTRDA